MSSFSSTRLFRVWLLRFVQSAACLGGMIAAIPLVSAQSNYDAPRVMRAQAVDESEGGLGLVVRMQGGRLVVDRTMPEGASAAFVRKGDYVVSIDGAEISPTLSENVKRLRGQAGSEVNLEVQRFVRQALPGRLSIPMRLTRRPLSDVPVEHVSTTAGYLRELAFINRHYLIDTICLPPFGTDRTSLGDRLSKMVALEADAGPSASVPDVVRSNVRTAIQNDFTVCGIIGTWDESKVENLRDLHSTAAKAGISLLRNGDTREAEPADFVARVLSRSFQTMASFSAYGQFRRQQDPHTMWFDNTASWRSVRVPMAPFDISDVEFICDPHWQFLRENQAPTDYKPGLGRDYPGPRGRGTDIPISMRQGAAKIRVQNRHGLGRWNLVLNDVPRAKYFFMLIEMNSGVLALQNMGGPPCTWASAYDAWEFNSGVVGGLAGNSTGMQIYHLPMPVLGTEGEAASGNVYVWFTDDLSFPPGVRSMEPCAIIGD